MSLPIAFDTWMADVEARYLADLRFAEVARALRAVSSAYVERRGTLAQRGVFDTAGKRAAYALYYAPIHFLTVANIAHALRLDETAVGHLLDWGCGTGASGAAWASLTNPHPRITAIDSHPWAVREAAATYRTFGLEADTRRGVLAGRPASARGQSRRATARPRSGNAVIAGWVLNEVPEHTRDALHEQLVDAASRGIAVLIVEPIAMHISPWWAAWAKAFERMGGRSDEWRFSVELPDLVRRLDKAAGMRHDELTARSLFVNSEQKLGAGI